MNFRDVKRRMRAFAADHLYSLEVYDEFPEEDEDRVIKAIQELQDELRYRCKPTRRLREE